MSGDLKMPEINTTVIAGNATKDVVNAVTKSGTSYSKFRIASTRRFKTRDGERKEDTTYIDVLYYGNHKLIENIKKGDPLYIEGRLSQDDWETESGEKRSKYQIVAQTVQKLSWDEKYDASAHVDESQIPRREHADVTEDIPF